MDIDVITARARRLREKVQGDGAALPPLASPQAIVTAAIGGIIAIGVVALLTRITEADPVFILGSFGATCVLVFGFPDAPFSQPRNIVGGHFISSLVGLSFVQLFNIHWWSIALATGAAIAAMMATRTVHPPAGSNPVIVGLGGAGLGPDWEFLFMPTLVGAILVTAVALVYNNLVREARYPKYW
jgi:CBS-domain-containing membrane protein